MNTLRKCCLFLLVYGLLILTGCGANPSIPATSTAAPAATIPPTLPPTLPPTFTPTTPPTQAPTLTLPPTATITLAPSPTPAGFYRNNAFQFGMVLPPGWTVTEKGTQVQFKAPSSSIALAVTRTEGGSLTAEAALTATVNSMRSSETKIFSNSTLGKKDTVILGDGTQAVRQVITGTYLGLVNYTVEIACAKNNNQMYAFVTAGDSVVMTASENLLTGIYETMTLGNNAPSAPTLMNADSIVGNWSGTMAPAVSFGSPGTSILKIAAAGCTLGKVCGTFLAVEAPCSGNILLKGIVGKTFILEEQLTGGASFCGDGGHEQLRLLMDGTLSFHFVAVSSSGVVSWASKGVLKRQ